MIGPLYPRSPMRDRHCSFSAHAMLSTRCCITSCPGSEDIFYSLKWARRLITPVMLHSTTLLCYLSVGRCRFDSPHTSGKPTETSCILKIASNYHRNRTKADIEYLAHQNQRRVYHPDRAIKVASSAIALRLNLKICSRCGGRRAFRSSATQSDYQ